MGYDAVTSAAIDAAWRSDAKIVYVVFVWVQNVIRLLSALYNINGSAVTVMFEAI